MNSIKESIIKTLAFFSLYKRPLKREELDKFLWKNEADSKTLEKALSSMPTVRKQENDMYLLGAESEYMDAYKKNQQRSHKYWEKVAKYKKYMEMVPFIKGVAVCNTLAFSAVKQGSDIDLFIITKKGRLWTSRLLMTILLHILGVRRHGSKIAERFCLSFFISERKLDLSNIALDHEDIYFAYWMAMLKPIIDRNIFDAFYRSNAHMLRSMLPKFHFKKEEETQKKQHRSIIRLIGEWILGGKIGDAVESIIRKPLLKRANAKKEKVDDSRGILISDDIQKFHNIDQRRDIQKQWKRVCEGNLR